MTVPVAAQRLGCSEQRVYNLVKQLALEKRKFPGLRPWYISERSIGVYRSTHEMSRDALVLQVADLQRRVAKLEAILEIHTEQRILEVSLDYDPQRALAHLSEI